MFVVQGNSAVNIDKIEVIEAIGNEIVVTLSSDNLGFYINEAMDEVLQTTIAKFDNAEQAKEYLALILKAYANGDKVFYC